MKSKYLDPHTLNKLSNLSLKARFIVEGFIIGLHKSPYHGFSVEFSEHRPYTYGDEIKNIDWKLWSRTDKYFIKQFEEETNLKAHIILDQSQSMNYTSNTLTKFEYAKMLAASFSYLLIKQQDAVGLALFDNKISYKIPPKSVPSHLNVLLKTMEKSQPGSKTDISKVLHHYAESINKRGLVIVLSDLFDDPEKIITALKHFRYKGHEVLVFQILDQDELEFKFNKRTKFIDKETGETIITNPWHFRSKYLENMNKFFDKINKGCRANKIQHTIVSTNDSLDKALTDFLIKRKNI